jgi:hypothetical protein
MSFQCSLLVKEKEIKCEFNVQKSNVTCILCVRKNEWQNKAWHWHNEHLQCSIILNRIIGSKTNTN